MPPPVRLLLLSAAVAGLGLAACGSSVEAPGGAGVCWHMVQLKDGKYRFNKLAENQPNLENCAARLEDMRLHFNALGANQTEEVGAYQGQFLFVEPQGIFSATSLTTTRYVALVRTGDGRLAIPGAMKQ